MACLNSFVIYPEWLLDGHKLYLRGCRQGFTPEARVYLRVVQEEVVVEKVAISCVPVSLELRLQSEIENA
jgi:hypothetical protein